MVIICCAFPGCAFKTEDLQEAVACTDLQSHVYGHAVLPPPTAGQMAPDRRCPTLDRPSIDIGVSLEEWKVFTRRWEAFRRGSRISHESASSQLFRCATKILGDNLLPSDAEIVSKPVQELLLAMQRLAVIPVAISVLRSELLAMHQTRGEQFRAFAARVRGKAGTCSFSTDCSCGLRSVYTKCDFIPICCRTKFHQIFDVSS